MTIKELRIIQYALCYLYANWDEWHEEDLPGITHQEIEILANKYIDKYGEAKAVQKD